ncbi:MAG: hypothetical protein JWP87_3376 [Labilithrix sp.]|nr:hypothetical protein [Labilithrix sp.]
MTKNYALLGLLSLSGLAVACGATTEEPAPAPPAVAEAPAPVEPPAAEPPAPVLDHGAPSTKYPAFPPAMGQLKQNGGSVLKNPVIITVTWPGDDKAADLETLGDTIGAGQYWKDVTSEYGASAAISGEAHHVRLADAAPASMSDTQLDAFVASHVGAATDGWPVPAGDAVYILYLPKGTQLMLQGKSACSSGVGGYHDSTKVNGKSTAYAIVPRCGTDFDHITLSASHELAEAATDPYPRSRPAWYGFREEDLAWEFFQQFQSENGDACEFYRDSDLDPTETGLAFTVQRQWSNASAKAGHDPCVPAFKGATYFNVTPLNMDDIDVDLSAIGGDTATTKGFKVKVGATRQIPLGFYSDGAMGPWTIKAISGGIAGGRSSGGVDLELDVTEGQNGQKAYLTVTVNTAGKTNSELVTIVSTHGGVSHYMPLLLGR